MQRQLTAGQGEFPYQLLSSQQLTATLLEQEAKSAKGTENDIIFRSAYINTPY